MNNRGQLFFFTFMVFVVILILALAFAPGLKTQVEEVRSSDNMDCTNGSISTFDKVTCRVNDLTLFYFIGGLIFIAGAIATARVVIK